MRNLAFEVYNRTMQRFSNNLFAGVSATPPLVSNPNAGTILFCALNQPNYRAYILAAKSFLRYHTNVAVVVQSDGSLTESAVEEIHAHLPGVTVHSREDMLDEIDAIAIPELRNVLPGREAYARQVPVRILYLKFLNVVLRLLRDEKRVVVIDSDLIFVRKPDAIIDWITGPYRHDFYGEGANAEADRYRALGFTFEHLDVADFSSGTIGVGGSVAQEELVEILSRISSDAPELFTRWEIEQALWAIVMARRPNPMNLDSMREVYIGSGWRRYHELRDKAVIAHFAGAIRFKNFRYLRLAQAIISDLRTTSVI